MPNPVSKFFRAPLFEHQKASDQAKILNRFVLIGLFLATLTMVLAFVLRSPRTGLLLVTTAVYLVAVKALLQMRWYPAAAWSFLIGITLANFVLGGMFPDFPVMALSLPFLVVAARYFVSLPAALLMLAVNLAGFAVFVQPIQGAEAPRLVVFGGTALLTLMMLYLVDQVLRIREQHFRELQSLSNQFERDHEAMMAELTHTKEVLISEQENRKMLEKKQSLPYRKESAPQPVNAQGAVMVEAAVKAVLEREIARTRRYQRPLSLLCIKIDDLSSVVEQSGVEREKLLSVVSDLFIETLRREDMVGMHGEDGFYVILPETGRYASYVVGERLRHMVEVMELPALGDLVLTVSVGITAFLDQAKMTPERFLEQSQEAVQAAIEHGGNWTISWQDMSHSTI